LVGAELARRIARRVSPGARGLFLQDRDSQYNNCFTIEHLFDKNGVV
jgi:hypothetical protein